MTVEGSRLHTQPYRFAASAATWDAAERSLLGAECGHEINADRATALVRSGHDLGPASARNCDRCRTTPVTRPFRGSVAALSSNESYERGDAPGRESTVWCPTATSGIALPSGARAERAIAMGDIAIAGSGRVRPGPGLRNRPRWAAGAVPVVPRFRDLI